MEKHFPPLTFSLGGDLPFFVVRNSFLKISFVSDMATEKDEKRDMTEEKEENDGRGVKEEEEGKEENGRRGIK
jgi:hypothetical protein